MSKIYQMNLAQIPFDLFQSGKKKVEMRLNKNGRDKIQPGDYIIFTNQKSGEQMKALVLSVSKYSSFNELYASFPQEMLGYDRDEKADPDDMLIYYKKEDILRYGVLAISVQICQN